MELMPDMTKWSQLNKDMMAQPFAGLAAASAIGIGLTGHAFGVWMGALSGAAGASQRLFAPIYDELCGDAASFRPKQPSPAAKAKSAAAALIERAASQEAAVKPAPTAKPSMPAQAAKATETAPVAEAEAAQSSLASQPASADRPEAPDDLKLIAGIGPKLETVLNGLGIWTFGQIAAWGGKETAWVDDHLGFKGRVGRDDWIGQAAKLAAAKD